MESAGRASPRAVPTKDLTTSIGVLMLSSSRVRRPPAPACTRLEVLFRKRQRRDIEPLRARRERSGGVFVNWADSAHGRCFFSCSWEMCSWSRGAAERWPGARHTNVRWRVERAISSCACQELTAEPFLCWFEGHVWRLWLVMSNCKLASFWKPLWYLSLRA